MTTTTEAFDSDYVPGTMSWSDGFLGPTVLAARAGVEYNPDIIMKYDHDLAVSILRQEIAGGEVESAQVGLDGDWIENSATIFDIDWVTGEEVIITEPDFYDGSVWAAPTMIVEYRDGSNKAFRVYKEIPTDEF